MVFVMNSKLVKRDKGNFILNFLLNTPHPPPPPLKKQNKKQQQTKQIC